MLHGHTVASIWVNCEQSSYRFPDAGTLLGIFLFRLESARKVGGSRGTFATPTTSFKGLAAIVATVCGTFLDPVTVSKGTGLVAVSRRRCRAGLQRGATQVNCWTHYEYDIAVDVDPELDRSATIAWLVTCANSCRRSNTLLHHVHPQFVEQLINSVVPSTHPMAFLVCYQLSFTLCSYSRACSFATDPYKPRLRACTSCS